MEPTQLVRTYAHVCVSMHGPDESIHRFATLWQGCKCTLHDRCIEREVACTRTRTTKYTVHEVVYDLNIDNGIFFPL